VREHAEPGAALQEELRADARQQQAEQQAEQPGSTSRMDGCGRRTTARVL
jgi:hypothetical protein